MTTMIERVAQAIYAKNAAAAAGRLPWAKAQDATKESVRDLARAAIEEMREPTDGMLDASSMVMDWYKNIDRRVLARESYIAAINAALKEDGA